MSTHIQFLIWSKHMALYRAIFVPSGDLPEHFLSQMKGGSPLCVIADMHALNPDDFWLTGHSNELTWSINELAGVLKNHLEVDFSHPKTVEQMVHIEVMPSVTLPGSRVPPLPNPLFGIL